MKKIAMLLALTMVATQIAACSGSGDAAEPAVPAASVVEPTAVAEEPESPVAESTSSSPEPIEFPLFDEPTELTYFWRFDLKTAQSLKDYNEVRMYQEMEKLTNVKIKWISPATGQEVEAFNLMRMSGDYPDIIFWEDWFNTLGGPQKALDDNFLLPLNDLMAQYSPNLTALMEEEPQIRKDIMTDSGVLYGYPTLRYKLSMKGVWGWYLRGDWLEKVGMDVPVTIDEFHDVLLAFKEQKLGGENTIPFTGHKERFFELLWAWGIDELFSIDDSGKVVYGPYTENYRQAMTTLSQWFAEGLIDPDFASNDPNQFESKVITHQAGAFYGETGGASAMFHQTWQADGNTEAKLLGITTPVLKEGDTPKTLYTDKLYQGAMASISTSNPYPVESAKYLDYGYSKEGQLLYNFGIEGESYTMEGDRPVFTSEITDNPDGLSIDHALAKFSIGSLQGAYAYHPEVRDQRMLFFDYQREAIDAWDLNDGSGQMPAITLTADESSRFADIMGDIKTYTEENFYKFINGSAPIETFDDYLATLKSMGIEDAIAIQQAAVDRYNAR